MARFEMKGLDELVRAMQAKGQESGEVAQRMLMAGAEAVRAAWQHAAEAHDLRDTGAMIASIGYARAPKKAGDILSIDIYPQGTDGKGVRNATKAFVLHYGTSRIPATRWVDDADAESGETVMPAMQAVWDAFIAGE